MYKINLSEVQLKIELQMEETLCDFNRYLLRKELSSETIKYYMFYYNKFPHDQELTQDLVDRFLDLYVKKNTKVMRAFVNNYLEFKKRRDIEIPKLKGRKEEKILKILTREQILKILESMNSQRDKLMLLLSFEGCLRLSEMINITPVSFRWREWKDNRAKPGTLKVTGKGNREREVHLSSAIMYNLYEFTKARCNYIDKEEKLFGISKRRWQRILEVASIKALGSRVHPHTLRHVGATNLIERGFNLVELRDYLGHKDVSTTQIYVHPNKEIIKDKFEKIFNQENKVE